MTLLSILQSPENVPSSAQAYLDGRFSRALLVLGDLTSPLRPLTEYWVGKENGRVSGVAALFRGFRVPMLSLVTDREEAAISLVQTARRNVNGKQLIAVHADESWSKFLSGVRQTDLWMTCETGQTDDLPKDVVPLHSIEELQAFYARQKLHFWAPAMLKFGHAFGIRSGGELVSAAGINFVLDHHTYAQIGSIATDARYRCRGFASTCIRAVLKSLHQAGIYRCGLFADSQSSRLLQFYSNRNFRENGRYEFIEVEG